MKKVIKKIIGIFLIIGGGLISLATTVNILEDLKYNIEPIPKRILIDIFAFTLFIVGIMLVRKKQNNKKSKENSNINEIDIEKNERKNFNYDLSDLDSIVESNKLKEYIKKVHKRYTMTNVYLIGFTVAIGMLMIISAFSQNLKPDFIFMTMSFVLVLLAIFGILAGVLFLQERNGKKKMLNCLSKEDWKVASKQIEETEENLADVKQEYLTMLTKDYLVYGMKMPLIINYNDIVWSYIVKVKMYGVVEIGKSIVVFTKDGKRHNLVVLKSEEFLERLYEKNNSIAIGFTSENKAKFKKFLSIFER